MSDARDNYLKRWYGLIQRSADDRLPVRDAIDRLVAGVSLDLLDGDSSALPFADFDRGIRDFRDWVSRALTAEPLPALGHIVFGLYHPGDGDISLGCDIELDGCKHRDPNEWHPYEPRLVSANMKSGWLREWYRELIQYSRQKSPQVECMATVMLPLQFLVSSITTIWHQLLEDDTLSALRYTDIYAMWSGGDLMRVIFAA